MCFFCYFCQNSTPLQLLHEWFDIFIYLFCVFNCVFLSFLFFCSAFWFRKAVGDHLSAQSVSCLKPRPATTSNMDYIVSPKTVLLQPKLLNSGLESGKWTHILIQTYQNWKFPILYYVIVLLRNQKWKCWKRIHFILCITTFQYCVHWANQKFNIRKFNCFFSLLFSLQI